LLGQTNSFVPPARSGSARRSRIHVRLIDIHRAAFSITLAPIPRRQAAKGKASQRASVVQVHARRAESVQLPPSLTEPLSLSFARSSLARLQRVDKNVLTCSFGEDWDLQRVKLCDSATLRFSSPGD